MPDHPRSLTTTDQEKARSPTLMAIHGLKVLPADLALAIDQRVHPEDRAELSRILFDSVKNHTSFEHQYRIVWPDGAVRWLEGRGKTQYSSKGNPTILIGIVADITEQKLLALEVESRRQQLQNYFMQAPIAICR